MKIAIAAEGPNSGSALATVFGRCPYLLLVDTEKQHFVPHGNPGRGASEGSGLMAARLVVNRGAKVLIAPKVGRLAQGVLDRAGLRVHIRQGGTAAAALDAFVRKESA